MFPNEKFGKISTACKIHRILHARKIEADKNYQKLRF